jgi:type II secretory ATPase GspE/PulE/Tfp pilus assembly ATPase PilB-like protein/CheY-like chemotaxis protein
MTATPTSGPGRIQSALLDAAREVASPERAQHLPGTLPAGVRDAWRAVLAVSGADGAQLARAVATRLGVPAADLAKADPQVIRLVPVKVARRHGVLPLAASPDAVEVATGDPTDIEAERDLEFATGRSVRFCIAEPESVRQMIESLYAPEQVIEALVSGFGPAADGTVWLDDDIKSEPAANESIGAVRRLAATLLRDAVRQHASDIHLVQAGAQGVVRYRVDGIMRQVVTMPALVYSQVVSRIKIIGRLDITDRLRPQDGRGRLVVDGESVDIRLSTLPVEGGSERVVIRLLRHETIESLAKMDMAEPERGQLTALLGEGDGLVLMTGPTGSGKTTTLHAALRERLSEQLTIMTVENPVEYRIEGVSQVQVEPKQGLTFAAALRAILRQDPDIVLVGEIRDPETAETAVQAAMTGHLVLSTVHAEDAPGALLRLRDLGLSMDTLGQAFRGAAAQRLLRRLCPACRLPIESGAPDPVVQRFSQLAGGPPGARPAGCQECGFTGYRGRLPVHQVLRASDAVRAILSAGGDLSAVYAQARKEGMRSLGESAATRIRAGETTAEEAVRVLGLRFWDELSGAATIQPLPPPEASAEAEPAPAAGVATPRVVVLSRLPDHLQAMTAACAAAGADVVTATSAQDVRALVSDGAAVSLLVLDLQWDQSAKSEKAVGQLVDLRRVLGNLTTPVLLVVPPAHPFLIPLLSAGGVDDYLTHPIEPHQLTMRVRAALRRSELSHSAITEDEIPSHQEESPA